MPKIQRHMCWFSLRIVDKILRKDISELMARVKDFLFGRSERTSHHCTMGRMTMKAKGKVLGHSLLRSLFGSHRSIIRLLRTARFARALRCAHSFDRSLANSLTPGLMGRRFLDASTHLYKMVCLSVCPSVHPSVHPSVRPSRIFQKS